MLTAILEDLAARVMATLRAVTWADLEAPSHRSSSRRPAQQGGLFDDWDL
ncbi:hypothetical protein [Nocardioides sp. GY 10113]|nr:hypothetical protein [Nocardioides sp. GY 10113]